MAAIVVTKSEKLARELRLEDLNPDKDQRKIAWRMHLLGLVAALLETATLQQ